MTFTIAGVTTTDTLGAPMRKPGGYVYADLASFPDDHLRREIIDGELLVSPTPRLRHQVAVGRLFLRIGTYLEAHGGGSVFVAPVDVVFDDRNVCEPDVLFVADAQADQMTEMNVQGPPRLVIEVLSNPRIDRIRKRDTYGRFGVEEYWIVDAAEATVEIYRLGDTGFATPEVRRPPQTLTTPALPGLEIDLVALFDP